MIMNKIIRLAVLLLCFCSCAIDNDAIYYPVGNVDVENGGPALEDGKGELVARSYNTEDYVLDTVAQYPGNPTLGKLTFMVNLKNQLAGQEANGFYGIGTSGLTMSLGYKDGNYPEESQVPVYASPDVTTAYAVKLRLKGELTLSGDDWMIDFVYVQLASLFQPYPPASFPEVFMCKGGEQSFACFDSFRRTWTFDIEYNRSNLFFSQLYFNLFVNLAGQKREDRIRLRIDKESFFEIYKLEE
ncbi:DUF3845 domain-containing protein [Bacteroides acidifaciens]|uniref:DUF3845 domain-containing protein n=1 Tax=Bacteroides acidifaciens TaxID=85831 RepID=UPI00255818A4|nr:DUF3845 domain-containing protein [Bacteroides acidifaciens]